MIKIGICDDYVIYLNELSKIIKDITISNDIQVEITTFNCGEDLIAFCSKHNDYFDLIFLDVLMEGIDGINTAKNIRTIHSDTFIVFVTSSKEYALDSYSVNASGYILKPFSYISIESKLLELCNKIKLNNKNTIYVKNTTLQENLTR